jgi:hypothetical protein
MKRSLAALKDVPMNIPTTRTAENSWQKNLFSLDNFQPYQWLVETIANPVILCSE